MAGLVDAEDWSALEAFVGAFQMAVQALRCAPFPVVAAVQGLAVGGGCEFSLAADARVAAAALRMGLVSEVVAPEDLLARAQSIAAGIAANPPHAVRLTKQLMRASQNATLDELLDKSAAFQAVCHAEPDHMEAVNAFFEKRPGNYREQ